MSESSPNEDQVNLQLGDIIEIEAPGDDTINNKIFYINYIDPSEIRLKIQESGETKVLQIDDDKNCIEVYQICRLEILKANNFKILFQEIQNENVITSFPLWLT